LAGPYLDELSALTGDTIHLAIREGDEVLYLHKNPGRNGPEMRSRVGHRMPLARTGIGKALMLDDSPQEWQRLFEVSLPVGGKNQFWPQHPEQSWEQFERRMVEYVAGGYAFDLEDNEPSIRCVAAPIRDASKRIVAGISIASTVPYMPLEKMAELIPLIKGVTTRLSAELGLKV
jgi:DNA-binding IclR family transcriptional regulator